jgi:hypothetical protein
MFDKTVTISSTDGSIKLIITAGTEGLKTLMLRTPNSLSVVTPEEAMDWLQKGLNVAPAPNPPASSGS